MATPLHQMIVDYRAELQYTQQDLADLLGVQRVTISQWETGTRLPTKAQLNQLVELVQPAHLLAASITAAWLEA